MFIQLDENNYYTGNYTVDYPFINAYDIPNLPPYDDFQKQICCQYINNEWILDEQKYNKFRQIEQQGRINLEIQQLQKQLDESDYKIIKCMECSLIQKELPYNITQLHKQRQQIRDSINELQTYIKYKER